MIVDNAGVASCKSNYLTMPYIRWARLVNRVFAIDITTCPHCGGSLKIIAAITDAPVIRKVLTAMGLSAHPPPRSPARYDPQAEATLY